MNFERKETPESRTFSPNLHELNSQQYCQNRHIVSFSTKRIDCTVTAELIYVFELIPEYSYSI